MAWTRALGFAEWGGDELLIATGSCGAAAYALSLVHPALAVLPAIPFGIVLWFFRDPERSGEADPRALLSPADGTVADITEVEESAYIGGRALRIGIFLSPFNVHVNRVPCEGVVEHTEFRKGEFLPAYNPEAPTRNESALLGMLRPDGVKLAIKQITGVLARRIVCPAEKGARYERGQRYGMIKFGSRTELYIPLALAGDVRVKVGDTVLGGTTVLAWLPVNAAAGTTGKPETAQAEAVGA